MLPEPDHRPPNHTIVMWGSKGGAGTSVTAAGAAIHETKPTLVVDLDGDVAKILGRPNQAIGARTWLHSDVEPHRLTEFVEDIDDTTRLLQAGHGDAVATASPDRIAQLSAWIKSQPGIVVVDAGTGPPAEQLAAIADKNVMVTRADYLALSRPDVVNASHDQVILINDHLRRLDRRDVELATHAPVIGTIDIDPAVARSIDSGLFIGHRGIERGTTHLTDPTHHAGLPRPEIDYGMNWTRHGNPSATWRVSYDPGTHQLTAVNNATGFVDQLGTFRTESDVEESLEGWASHHSDPDGLSWLSDQLGVNAAVGTSPGPRPILIDQPAGHAVPHPSAPTQVQTPDLGIEMP